MMRNIIFLIPLTILLLVGNLRFTQAEQIEENPLLFKPLNLKIHLHERPTLTFYLKSSGIIAIRDRAKNSFLMKPAFFRKGNHTITLKKKLTADVDRLWLSYFMPQLRFIKRAGGLGSIGANFFNPASIHADRVKKEILIVDSGNDRIVRLDRDLNYIASFGAFGLNPSGGDSQDGSLNEPYDLIIGYHRRYILSDLENNTIKEFDEFGNYKKILFPPNNRLRGLIRPLGITRNRRHHYYFIDSGHSRIIKIDRLGGKLSSVGNFGSSAEKLNRPEDCAIDTHDRLHVLDSGNGKIVIYNRFDTYLSSHPIPHNFHRIFLDSDDLTWILGSSQIILLDGNHKILMDLQEPRWEELTDLALLDRKHLYVLDRSRHEILLYEFNWNSMEPIALTTTREN